MKTIKLIGLTIMTITLLSSTYAQDSTNSKNLSLVFLPVIASTPATGWMFGVAPSANWRMGNPSTTSLSSGVSSVIYTTKKQLLLTFKTNVFLKDDSWNLLGDWRYFITSQPTFGLGTGPQSARLVSDGIEYKDGLFGEKITTAQFMKFNYFRFHETFLKRIGDSRFFAGLGYHLDYHYKIDDQLLNKDTLPPAITSHYAYSKSKDLNDEKYVLSGISLNGLYDARDNTINPYSGRYALVTYRINPTFLGSDKTSSSLWLEYRDYFSLSKKRPRNLLALWVYSSMELSGSLPYLDLPALGWDQFGRSGRAYPQGRFRGETVGYAEAEWRFPLQKDKEKFGVVVFANMTTASNKAANINLFDFINTGVGAGLRIMINEKSRTNLCLDYAFGNYGSHGFYLSVNEVF